MYLWHQGRQRLQGIHLGGRLQYTPAGCGPPAPAEKYRSPHPTAAMSHQSWQYPHGGPWGGTPPDLTALDDPGGKEEDWLQLTAHSCLQPCFSTKLKWTVHATGTTTYTTNAGRFRDKSDTATIVTGHTEQMPFSSSSSSCKMGMLPVFVCSSVHDSLTWQCLLGRQPSRAVIMS